MPVLTPILTAPRTTENFCCYFAEHVDGHPAPPSEVGDATIPSMPREKGLWDNGQVITCAFIQNNRETANIRRLVKDAVREWEAYANVTFAFLPESAPVESAMVRINLGPFSDSWTYLAGVLEYLPRSVPTMNVVVLNPNASALSARERGAVWHQVGHVLGFLDEHKSPRRGEMLEFDEDKIVEHFTSFGSWTATEVLEKWEAYSEYEVGAVTSLDLESIMMFHLPKDFTKQGLEVASNTVLSPLDKAYAFLTYPYFKGDPGEAKCRITLDEALKIAGIEGDTRVVMKEKYAAGDWEGMRWSLSVFTSGQME